MAGDLDELDFFTKWSRYTCSTREPGIFQIQLREHKNIGEKNEWKTPLSLLFVVSPITALL
jgi:hypothetical protein